MHTYNNEAKQVLNVLITQIKELPTGNHAQLKSLYTLMEKADQIVIDCAHKLAPYQSPKLESIEVKGKVDHRYVIRTPQPMSTINEWMKHTGAQQAKLADLDRKEIVQSVVEPSLNDFTDDDEYNEPGMIN